MNNYKITGGVGWGSKLGFQEHSELATPSIIGKWNLRPVLQVISSRAPTSLQPQPRYKKTNTAVIFNFFF